MKEGPVGPGIMIENLLMVGPMVATVICSDNYFTSDVEMQTVC